MKIENKTNQLLLTVNIVKNKVFKNVHNTRRAMHKKCECVNTNCSINGKSGISLIIKYRVVFLPIKFLFWTAILWT